MAAHRFLAMVASIDSTENSQTIEDKLEILIRDLANSLPPHCASYSVNRNPQGAGGIIVALTPNSETAAGIVAHAQSGWDGVELIFGKGSVFEVSPKGKHYTNLPHLQEVQALCRAVIEGHFEETVWMVGSKIIKCVGKIVVSNKTIMSHWRTFFINPFLSRQQSLIRYRPYVAG